MGIIEYAINMFSLNPDIESDQNKDSRLQKDKKKQLSKFEKNMQVFAA